MSKKLTTSEFIARARIVHGDKYKYEFVDYQSTHTKVTIFCPNHSLFIQTPAHHLRGNGCPVCAGVDKSDTFSFVSQAKIVHGDVYDYSHVDYVNARTKITIKCKKHGSFTQTPTHHLSGNGCPCCSIDRVSFSNKSNTSDFIRKARLMHGDAYDYSLSCYISALEKVTIKCKKHGLFSQIPSSHLSGKGCPGCATTGFDRTKKGFLYILRSDCGRYMKIGITHRPDQRHAQLSRVTPFLFDCVELVEGQGDEVAGLEKELLSLFKPANFTEKFDGSTEWRLWSDNVRNKL